MLAPGGSARSRRWSTSGSPTSFPITSPTTRRASSIYTHDMLEPVRARRSRGAPRSRISICMDGPQDGALSLPELMAAELAPPPDPWDETAIAHLSYTSGTTGKPKGACLAHEPTVRAARCIAERLRSRRRRLLRPDRPVELLPAGRQPAAAARHGRERQRHGPLDADDRLGCDRRARRDLLVGNPTLLEEVLTESRTRGAKPGQLRFGLSGGGPVPPTLKIAWRDELRLAAGRELRPERARRLRGARLPELEPDDAKIAADRPAAARQGGPHRRQPTTEPLPLGTVGEIVLRGGFMAGYWGKPDKTAEATRGGWLRTGDLGLIDGDGFVTNARPPLRTDRGRWHRLVSARRRGGAVPRSRACARRH